MAINSKSKGDKFERKLATLLSVTFSEYTKVDKAFIRNRSSGAYLGGKNSHRAVGMLDDHKDVGDIIVPSNFRFEIEAKHYKTPTSLKSILTQQNAQWDKWIKQASQDVKTSGRDGFILIVKYNLVPELVILDECFNTLPCIKEKFILRYKNHLVMTLDDLLSCDHSIFFKKE